MIYEELLRFLRIIVYHLFLEKWVSFSLQAPEIMVTFPAKVKIASVLVNFLVITWASIDYGDCFFGLFEYQFGVI